MATIVRYIKPLVWLNLDSLKQFDLPKIYHESSTDLFPCGWSETFGCPLKVPRPFASCDDRFFHRIRTKYLTLEAKTCDLPLYAYMPPKYSPSKKFWSIIISFLLFIVGSEVLYFDLINSYTLISPVCKSVWTLIFSSNGNILFVDFSKIFSLIYASNLQS